MLEPLNPEQRTTLVTAMETVARLLTAGLVEIAVEDPTTDAAQRCIGAYFAELDSRFDAGFDPALSITADASELIEPAGLLLLGRLRGEPIGCGALKFHGREPVEIKRMWVGARGLGSGAASSPSSRRTPPPRVRVARLETNRSLDEPSACTARPGTPRSRANAEPHAHHWFEKRCCLAGHGAVCRPVICQRSVARRFAPDRGSR